MHTDDHILEHFLAAKHPLPALAAHLGMTLIALVHWVDRNADLLAAAKRSLETHLAFLALNAEAAALIDLTQVSHSTTNEERKRKSSSQLLRHAAKRLLTAVGSSSSFSPQGGEKVPSTEGARGMMGIPNAVLSSTNPERELRAPCASEPLNALSESPPSPRLDGGNVPTISGVREMMDSPSAPSPNPTRDHDASHEPSLDTAIPLTPPLLLSDDEADRLMAILAHHFQVDVKAVLAEPDEPTDIAPATTA